MGRAAVAGMIVVLQARRRLSGVPGRASSGAAIMVTFSARSRRAASLGGRSIGAPAARGGLQSGPGGSSLAGRSISVLTWAGAGAAVGLAVRRPAAASDDCDGDWPPTLHAPSLRAPG